MAYYIQFDNDYNVTGYSTSKMNDKDLRVDEELLEADFLEFPLFYRYENGGLVFKSELRAKRQREIRGALTENQLLGQENSELSIQLSLLRQHVMGTEVLITNETIDKWKARYEKKWASLEQIESMVNYGLLNQSDFEYITGGLYPL